MRESHCSCIYRVEGQSVARGPCKRGGMSAVVNFLSSILGKKLVLLFGKECLRATTCMCISMFIRYLVSVFYLEKYVPVGMIFSFPYIIQLVCLYVPWMESKIFCSIPLLPIRLAESILGRITPIKLTVVIPAHFLGCILGAVMCRSFFPYIDLSNYAPLVYQHSFICSFIVEILVVCLYVCIVIGLPDLLIVNKFNSRLISIPILPLLLVGIPDKGTSFNPAVVYALWYINEGNLHTYQNLQFERIIAPILGAVFGGIICRKYIPDDHSSWKRKR